MAAHGCTSRVHYYNHIPSPPLISLLLLSFTIRLSWLGSWHVGSTAARAAVLAICKLDVREKWTKLIIESSFHRDLSQESHGESSFVGIRYTRRSLKLFALCVCPCYNRLREHTYIGGSCNSFLPKVIHIRASANRIK